MLRELDGATAAHIFGKNQQGQRGIDIRVQLEDGTRCAGQCKAYSKFDKSDLTALIKEFRIHLDFWKTQRLRRFIVLVGCEVDDRFVQEDLDTYRTEFIAHEIEIELWDSREIERRLRTHPDLVRAHLPEWAFERICGSALIGDLHQATQPSISPSFLEELGLESSDQLDQIR